MNTIPVLSAAEAAPEAKPVLEQVARALGRSDNAFKTRCS